jgi:formylglycine-generating enzyme required for sulfatase activity
MNKYFFILIALAILSATGAKAQVTIGSTTDPHSFSILELVSGGNRGLRLSQMTTEERDAMVQTEDFQAEKNGKARGLQIFNMTTKCVETWNGTTWILQCAQVDPPEAPTASSPQTFCSGNNPTIADLVATGVDIKWYYSPTEDGTALASTDALVNGTSYYASQTVDGCESTERRAVTVTVNAPQAPTASSPQTFCSGNNPTVGNLSATGESGATIKWYSSSSSGTALASTNALVNGTSYYASQTVNGCESTARRAVTVTLGNCADTPSPASSCGITASNGNKTFTAKADPNAFGYEFFVNAVSQGLQTSNIKTFDAAKTGVTVKYYYSPAFLKPTMVSVAGGSFIIGAEIQKGTYNSNTVTKYYEALTNNHTVNLTGFKMSKTHVTQAQFEYVMGINPAQFQCSTDIDYAPSSSKPVEFTSWYDAIAYCNKLSIMEGRTPCYSVNGIDWAALDYGAIPTYSNTNWNGATCNWDANGYRLPTEAEWEYAARGGQQSYSKLNSGKYDYFFSGGNATENFVWCWQTIPSTTSGTAGYGTQPVATKQPNALNLYDMSGNLGEWCWDWYSEDYSSGTVTNPRGPSTGNGRILRGGYWNARYDYCGVSFREENNQYGRGNFIGFRVVSKD